MPTRTLIIGLLLCCLAACGTSSSTGGVADEVAAAAVEHSPMGDEPIVYRSTENDLATIDLTIAPDQTWSLKMVVFAQFDPGVDFGPDNKDEQIAYSGMWIREADWYELTFVGDVPKPGSLFDEKYGDQNQFINIDERRVKINTGRETIAVWGIDCTKHIDE